MRTGILVFVTLLLLGAVAAQGNLTGQNAQTNASSNVTGGDDKAAHHRAMLANVSDNWTLQELGTYCAKSMRPASGNGTNATPPDGLSAQEAEAYCEGAMVGFCASMGLRSGHGLREMANMTPRDILSSCHQWMMQEKNQTGDASLRKVHAGAVPDTSTRGSWGLSRDSAPEGG